VPRIFKEKVRGKVIQYIVVIGGTEKVPQLLSVNRTFCLALQFVVSFQLRSSVAFNFKGTVSRDLRHLWFFVKLYPGSPDLWVKRFRKYSAQCYIARRRSFC
jgi:hypothetical protein